MRTRALLIGGNGFLGRAAATELSAHHEVHVLDRPGSAGTGPSAVLAQYEGSVTSPQDVQAAMDAARPDVVVLLASHGGGGVGLVRAAERAPREAVDVNVGGLLTVLEAAARRPGCQVLWSSSTTVYGPTAMYPGPVDENAPVDPRSIYAATKVMGEQLVRSFRTTHGVAATAVRPTLVWGPGIQYRGVQSGLGDLVEAASAGRPLSVPASGEVWDLVYVTDAARSLAWLATRDAAAPGDLGPVVLVNGYRASLQQVRDAVVHAVPSAQLTLQDGGPVLGFPPVDDSLVRRAGFTPALDLEASVQAYLTHLRPHSPSHPDGQDPAS